jgi:putative SOS response-associated peptidase YedK
LAKLFGVVELPPLTPRYNIAPTQSLPIVRLAADGQREMLLARWGLVPSWAKDASIGNRLINARAESIADKPAFRVAYKRRRCLVPADGFFEWRRTGGGKQPFLIQRADREPFAMAGLWERWRHETDPPVDSFTIITTGARGVVAGLHDRMPVIVDPLDYLAWLDPAVPTSALDPVLSRVGDASVIARAVSARVNDPRNDEPVCVQPLTADHG